MPQNIGDLPDTVEMLVVQDCGRGIDIVKYYSVDSDFLVERTIFGDSFDWQFA